MTDDATLPEHLALLGQELRAAAYRLQSSQRRGMRGVRLIAALSVSLVVVAAGAVASERLFGNPAPESVKRDIGSVDDGLPTEIRLNPKVTEAYSVAESETAVLYYARLDDDGYCTQLVIAGKEHAAQCLTAAQAAHLPIAVTISTGDPATTSEGVTIAGRVNNGQADHLEVQIDAEVTVVEMGDEGFFVFDVDASQLSAARSNLSVTAVDASGEQVADTNLTPVLAEEEPASEPLEFTYRSDDRDLSLVLGLEGRVSDPDIASLELEYPDGSRQPIPLDGGRFRLQLPKQRQDDFAQEMGRLVARDSSGEVVVERKIASVAFWRGLERSGVFEKHAAESND